MKLLKHSTFVTLCRNRAKKNSFTTLNLAFLLLKTTFDSISRILLFSTWLYVLNDGQFSSTKTVIAYYSTFSVLFFFNSIFNKQNDFTKARTWIGKKKSVSQIFLILFLEIFFNSTSSVLSYNNFDFGLIFDKDKGNGGGALDTTSPSQRNQHHQRQQELQHEPTFLKQALYFLLFIALNLGYQNHW